MTVSCGFLLEPLCFLYWQGRASCLRCIFPNCGHVGPLPLGVRWPSSRATIFLKVFLSPSKGNLGSLVAQMVKNSLQCRRPGFDSLVGRITWRREWQPTPVFLPGKSHGQRSLMGFSPWGPKELDMTEWLTLSLSQHSTYLKSETQTYL